MTAYYNEFEPYAAQWLRNLISNKLIAHGDVDDRSITDVKADELKGYTQCHFFAGIGGWALALRLAGWADDVPVWTGSCPCQSFSTAGKQKGKSDERHLWPVWQSLIRECRPATVFGEQVANAIAHEWLDEVAADMEGEGYAVGSAVLPACSVGAPHRRDRLWFVADASSQRVHDERPGEIIGTSSGMQGEAWQQRVRLDTGQSSGFGYSIVADASSKGFQNRRGSQMVQPGPEQELERLCSAGAMAHSKNFRGNEGQSDAGGGIERSNERQGAELVSPCSFHVGDTCGTRSEAGLSASPCECQRQPIVIDNGSGGLLGPWEECEWITGHDGKARPVKSGIRFLAHGIPARVGALKGYGNAIVPQVAAEFISAFMECRP